MVVFLASACKKDEIDSPLSIQEIKSIEWRGYDGVQLTLLKFINDTVLSFKYFDIKDLIINPNPTQVNKIQYVSYRFKSDSLIFKYDLKAKNSSMPIDATDQYYHINSNIYSGFKYIANKDSLMIITGKAINKYYSQKQYNTY